MSMLRVVEDDIPPGGLESVRRTGCPTTMEMLQVGLNPALPAVLCRSRTMSVNDRTDEYGQNNDYVQPMTKYEAGDNA
nr:hypothetical protein CFP56_01075 [Quercus suber]